MPHVATGFTPSSLFRSATLQTILPALLRGSKPKRGPERKIFDLPDGDFLEFDYYRGDTNRLAIISHGLEGSSQARYVLGMTDTMQRAGFHVLAWNMRGCGGQLNRLLPSYHSGFTEDLAAIVKYATELPQIDEMVLIGFSIGGNLTLKLLGEWGSHTPQTVTKAIVFSVPTDLASSAGVLARPENKIYMKMFLRSLFKKLLAKAQRFPGELDLSEIATIATFKEYDSRFIAPFFGFSSAEDYWEKASSAPFLENIRIPTLLITSLDDPFLDPSTLPRHTAETNPYFFLEAAEYGGHVGFMKSHPWGRYYSEMRTLQFILQ